MIKLNEDILTTQSKELESNLDYYRKYGQPIVDEYSKELDDKVNAIQTYLNSCKEYNLDFDVLSLQRIVMELSTTIYFTSDKLEKLGLLQDMASIKYKDAYNQAYLNKQGDYSAGTKYTVEQLRNFAEQEAISEKLICFIYEHATKVIKGKIEAAYEVLKSVSKSLSCEIQSMSTFNVGNKYSQ